MFDLGSANEEENLKEAKYTYTQKDEFSEKELLSQEKEMLGIYLSGHPLEKLKEEIERQITISSKDIMQLNSNTNSIENEGNMPEIELQNQYETTPKFKDGQEVIFAGIITAIKKKFTKTNKIMAFITVEDLYGQVEVITFENAYLSAKDSLIEENIVLIKGRLSIRDEEKATIIANSITNFEAKKRKVLSINITNLDEDIKKKLRGALKYFSGEMNNIAVVVQDGDKELKCGAIYLTEQIFEVFKEIVGEENAKITEV